MVDGFSCGSFMNCKSLKPKDHYFWFQLQSEENDRSVHFLVRVMLKPWVNILPKNPYLAKRVVLKNLNLLKSKNDYFREHLSNY